MQPLSEGGCMLLGGLGPEAKRGPVGFTTVVTNSSCLLFTWMHGQSCHGRMLMRILWRGGEESTASRPADSLARLGLSSLNPSQAVSVLEAVVSPPTPRLASYGRSPGV